MTQPKASRPHMPGYGIADATSGKGLLPWSWATERLTNARNYWVATTRPDGHPHQMPVWGVWIDDAFYFSTGTQSRKARNLAENPKCVVGCELGPDQVIVEGVAELQDDAELRRKFAEAYQAKYVGTRKDSASRSTPCGLRLYSGSQQVPATSQPPRLDGLLISDQILLPII